MEHNQHRMGTSPGLPMAGGEEPGPGHAIDPVCGMTVDMAQAEARGLHFRHGDADYYFCGRGCRLDFEEDPDRFLDAGYTPSM